MARRRAIPLAAVYAAVCVVVVGAAYTAWRAAPWLMDTEGFVPRSECGTGWTPAMILQEESAHTSIFVIYQIFGLSILLGLRLVPPRLRLSAILWACFIASCGWTHATSRLMFRIPAYHLDVVVLDICHALTFAALLNLLTNFFAMMRRKEAEKLGEAADRYGA